MACRKCGSDWVTPTGKDCNRCPSCDKQQLFQARKQGRLPAVLEKTCRICGNTFTVKPTSQHATTCRSKECQAVLAREKALRHKERKALGLAGTQAPRQGRKQCKRDGCHAAVKDNRHDYCSPTCAGADAREYKRDFMGLPAEVRLTNAFADWMYGWESEKPVWMECQCCRKRIERMCVHQRVCSDKCRYRLEKPLNSECADCGCQLHAATRSVRRCVTCKKKRKRRLQALAGKTPRKRCLRNGVPCDPSVTRRAVFIRDGYVCQLCGVKCLQKFRVVRGKPHPLSPTVDHIVALSLGRKGHTWDNVQCCCWSCNVAKGAQAKGQLRFAEC